MGLLEVDSSLCTGDRLCVEVCPFGLIAYPDDADRPVMVEEGVSLCISCGHCLAVCPQGALSVKKMKPGDCPAVRDDLSVSSAQAEQFLRGRRSIRRYRDEAVPRETIERLIATASYAPSGMNHRPLRWLVIDSRPEVRRLAGLVLDYMKSQLASQSKVALKLRWDRTVQTWEKGEDRICRSAPQVIVAHAHEKDGRAGTTAALALAYLELAAFSLGLAACWAGYFQMAALNHPPMAEALALPDGQAVQGAIMIGYPLHEYRRLPPRSFSPVQWRR